MARTYRVKNRKRNKNMARTYRVTEYDKTDIEALQNMDKQQVVEELGKISDGWLPRDYVYAAEEGRAYSEIQYDATRLHVAVCKAMAMLEEMPDTGAAGTSRQENVLVLDKDMLEQKLRNIIGIGEGKYYAIMNAISQCVKI